MLHALEVQCHTPAEGRLSAIRLPRLAQALVLWFFTQNMEGVHQKMSSCSAFTFLDFLRSRDMRLKWPECFCPVDWHREELDLIPALKKTLVGERTMQTYQSLYHVVSTRYVELTKVCWTEQMMRCRNSGEGDTKWSCSLAKTLLQRIW
jgi:hypothetical protein